MLFLLASFFAKAAYAQLPATVTLPYARPNQPYSVQLSTNVSGRAPFTFELRPGFGELPKRITLKPTTGELAGVPASPAPSKAAYKATAFRPEKVPLKAPASHSAQVYNFIVDVADATGKILQSLPLALPVSSAPQPVALDSSETSAPQTPQAEKQTPPPAPEKTQKPENSAPAPAGKDPTSNDKPKNSGATAPGKPSLPAMIKVDDPQITVVSDPPPPASASGETEKAPKDTLELLLVKDEKKGCTLDNGTPLPLKVNANGPISLSLPVEANGVTSLTPEKKLEKGEHVCVFRTLTPAQTSDSATASAQPTTSASDVVQVQGSFVKPKFLQDPTVGATTVTVLATPTDAKNSGTTEVGLLLLPPLDADSHADENANKAKGKTKKKNKEKDKTKQKDKTEQKDKTKNETEDKAKAPIQPCDSKDLKSVRTSAPTLMLKGSKLTAATDGTGIATLTLADPLTEGTRICAYQTFTSSAGATYDFDESVIDKNNAASAAQDVVDTLDWGRIRAYFAGGVLIANDQNSFSSSSASPFLLFNLEKTWILPGCAILKAENKLDLQQHQGCKKEGAAVYHPGVTTYFETRMTAIPVQTGTSSSSSQNTSASNSGGSLSSQKTARLGVGIYAPWVLTHWYYDKAPNGLFLGPLAKVGFDTLTGSTSQTMGSGATASQVNFNRFYDHWGFGMRFGHYGLTNSNNKSPEILSYLDVTLGPYSNLQSYICNSTEGATLPNSACPPADKLDTRTALYRLDLEGILKIPKTVMFVGFNANVKAFGRKNLDLNLQPNDDLRFLFGVKLDVASVMKKLGVSTN
jgi:hypothetical protein